MADTFTWIPSKSFSSQTKTRVKTAQFGDGYSQRIGDGINSETKTWSLEFRSIDLTKAAEIIAHLKERKGIKPFKWAPPGDSTEYNVICQEWAESYDSHISRSLSMMFTQVFDPI